MKFREKAESQILAVFLFMWRNAIQTSKKKKKIREDCIATGCSNVCIITSTKSSASNPPFQIQWPVFLSGVVKQDKRLGLEVVMTLYKCNSLTLKSSHSSCR